MPYKMSNHHCRHCNAIFNQRTSQDILDDHVKLNHPNKNISNAFVVRETGWMNTKQKIPVLRAALKENGPMFREEVNSLMKENGFEHLPTNYSCRKHDIYFYTNRKKYRFTIYFLGIQKIDAWERIMEKVNPKGYWKGIIARALGVYRDVMLRP